MMMGSRTRKSGGKVKEVKCIDIITFEFFGRGNRSRKVGMKNV